MSVVLVHVCVNLTWAAWAEEWDGQRGRYVYILQEMHLAGSCMCVGNNVWDQWMYSWYLQYMGWECMYAWDRQWRWGCKCQKEPPEGAMNRRHDLTI